MHSPWVLFAQPPARCHGWEGSGKYRHTLRIATYVSFPPVAASSKKEERSTDLPADPPAKRPKINESSPKKPVIAGGGGQVASGSTA